jgi:hypothetical protein
MGSGAGPGGLAGGPVGGPAGGLEGGLAGGFAGGLTGGLEGGSDGGADGGSDGGLGDGGSAGVEGEFPVAGEFNTTRASQPSRPLDNVPAARMRTRNQPRWTNGIPALGAALGKRGPELKFFFEEEGFQGSAWSVRGPIGLAGCEQRDLTSSMSLSKRKHDKE